jgi:3-hydroxybutyryl-CoA dehydrogenase
MNAMPVRTVGVVGAGVMGAELAQVLAAAGYDVSLIDRTPESLQRAKRAVVNAQRCSILLGGRGAASRTKSGEISYSTSVETALANADFVIENVTERWSVKSELYPVLDRVCPEHAVLAANTSTIPVRRLAECTRRPSQVLGLHFMNPASLTRAVELVVTPDTSTACIATATDVLSALQKKWVVVHDSPGFVSNRVLMLTINEAVAVLADGVASAESIDELFRSCFGHKMGPLETADLIGLDTVLLSLESLEEAYGAKFAPCALLRSFVAAGKYGQKSGAGFYAYEV